MNQYKQAIDASTEYFNGDSLAAHVFVDKYSLRSDNGVIIEPTPEQMHRRLAKEFARIEKGKFNKPMSEDEIFFYFDRFKYIIPQGGLLYGVGNNKQIVSLSNCYGIESPIDSYGGILKTDQELVQISKRRGGVGTDVSTLRPCGSPTKNSSRSSSGLLSFAARYSNSIREVGQDGRRGALMLICNVHHPEILNFISSKNDEKSITGANISIKLTDEFLKAVKNDKEYELRFPVDSDKPIFSEKINARKVWKAIIHNAWLRAEPGLLFWDNIINYNAVDCYADDGFKTITTNPCSELPLCADDSCRLLVVNLYSYVKNPFTRESKLDYELLHYHSKVAQRLMDDVIDLEIEKLDQIIKKIEKDPEPKEVKQVELDLWQRIKNKCVNGRRTGLGVTGEGDMIAAMGLAYGSEESIKLVNEVHKTIKLASFRSSVEMARELGTFPIWNWKKEKDSAFLKQIEKEDETLYNDIKQYGRRNIANLTVAPTGSVCIVAQTTGGIEPLFELSYIRRKKINPSDKNARIDYVDITGDSWQEFRVYHPKVKEWMRITGETDVKKSPWFGSCAEEIDWKSRVRLQAAIQKHVDHAISSTINLPENVSESKIAEIYETAWEEGLKGITVYRKNCRAGVMIDDKQKNKIKKTIAPDRPSNLMAEMHHLVVKGHRYYCAVGMYGNDPYEVFVGDNNNSDGEIIIPKTVNTGHIFRKSSGLYLFITPSKEEYVLMNRHSDPNIIAITRLVSTALRHGSSIEFIVEQLGKVEGDLNSFSKVLARTLKKYIMDGTISHEKCPNCGAKNLIFAEGCKKCNVCGYSGCN